MDIVAERHVGGMIEYKDVLIFRSKSMRAYWKRQVTDGRASGTVRSKGKPLFRFQFDEHGCKIQTMKNGQPVGEWQEMDYIIVMCD